MLKIGLTGSIATGKSTILEAFRAEGVPVFSADEAVHALYRGAAVAPVEALFSGVTTDGAIDRAKLSALLVASPDRLKALEAVVHPLVRGDIIAFFTKAEASGAPLAVIDVPLLLETGYDYGIHRIAVTACKPETQRARALARPGMSVEKLDSILARQMSQEDKRSRADYLFDTDLPKSENIVQVQALIASIKARHTT